MCTLCQQGDPYVTCMKDENNICPIADLAPVLIPANATVLDIFRNAQGSSKQVDAKDKPYMYLVMTDIEASMRIHDVSQEDQSWVVEKVMVMQDMANRFRPMHRKTGKR